LVLVDRYFYNYYLDPVSMKYSGPSSWLECARRFLPRPAVVITLRAPKDILLQRKQELSEAEILRQAATLETLEFKPARVIAADASRSAEEVARTTLAEIVKAAP
jgi:thymidylate kinase